MLKVKEIVIISIVVRKNKLCFFKFDFILVYIVFIIIGSGCFKKGFNFNFYLYYFGEFFWVC